MSHTKEPWRLGKLTHPRDYETVRETVGPHDVVVDTDDGVYVLASCNYNFPQDALANARRIVACVNACAGISTENLEDNIPVKELARRYNETIRQRDELLAAAEVIEINSDEVMDFDECTAMLIPMDDYHRLMEAIASAKGGVL